LSVHSALKRMQGTQHPHRRKLEHDAKTGTVVGVIVYSAVARRSVEVAVRALNQPAARARAIQTVSGE
jgi:hypothetical protein